MKFLLNFRKAIRVKKNNYIKLKENRRNKLKCNKTLQEHRCFSNK